MSDPYNWKFPQRIDTMYLSTLGCISDKLYRVKIKNDKDNSKRIEFSVERY
jgi:hypothetical protein